MEESAPIVRVRIRTTAPSDTSELQLQALKLLEQMMHDSLSGMIKAELGKVSPAVEIEEAQHTTNDEVDAGVLVEVGLPHGYDLNAQCEPLEAHLGGFYAIPVMITTGTLGTGPVGFALKVNIQSAN